MPLLATFLSKLVLFMKPFVCLSVSSPRWPVLADLARADESGRERIVERGATISAFSMRYRSGLGTCGDKFVETGVYSLLCIKASELKAAA